MPMEGPGAAFRFVSMHTAQACGSDATKSIDATARLCVRCVRANVNAAPEEDIRGYLG